MNKQGEHDIGQKLMSLDFRQLAHEAKGQIPQVYADYEIPKFLKRGYYKATRISNGATDYDAALIERAICLALEKVKDE